MHRVRTTVVLAAFALFTLAGPGAASAATCSDDLQTTCATAATVVCQVVAKGEPCLM